MNLGEESHVLVILCSTYFVQNGYSLYCDSPSRQRCPVREPLQAPKRGSDQSSGALKSWLNLILNHLCSGQIGAIMESYFDAFT